MALYEGKTPEECENMVEDFDKLSPRTAKRYGIEQPVAGKEVTGEILSNE